MIKIDYLRKFEQKHLYSFAGFKLFSFHQNPFFFIIVRKHVIDTLIHFNGIIFLVVFCLFYFLYCTQNLNIAGSRVSDSSRTFPQTLIKGNCHICQNKIKLKQKSLTH